MFFVQKNVMPFGRKLRREIAEEVADEIHRVIRIGGWISLHWIERPDPCVFMIINIMSEFVETEHVMKIIPRDAAEGKLAYEACDDDAKFAILLAHSRFHVAAGSSI